MWVKKCLQEDCWKNCMSTGSSKKIGSFGKMITETLGRSIRRCGRDDGGAGGQDQEYKTDGDRHFTEEGRIAEITIDFIFQARVKMTEVRVNEPEDSIVTEMIKQLPPENSTRLQEVFRIALWDWKKLPVSGGLENECSSGGLMSSVINIKEVTESSQWLRWSVKLINWKEKKFWGIENDEDWRNWRDHLSTSSSSWWRSCSKVICVKMSKFFQNLKIYIFYCLCEYLHLTHYPYWFLERVG